MQGHSLQSFLQVVQSWRLCSPFSLQRMECRVIHSNHSRWLRSLGTSKVPSRCSTYNAGHTTRITLAGYAVLAPLQHVLTAVHAMQVTPLESLSLVNALLAPLQSVLIAVHAMQVTPL